MSIKTAIFAPLGGTYPIIYLGLYTCKLLQICVRNSFFFLKTIL